MASAKEYFKNRKNELYSKEYKENLRRHRKKVFIITASTALAVVVACVVIYLYNVNRKYTGYSVLAEATREESGNAGYVELDNSIVRYGMDGVACYDQKHNMQWNQSYEMKDPMIDICESYMALCDKGGTKFYVFSKDGLKGEVDTQLSIKRIEVANQGVVAVLVEDGELNRINYYDRMGNLLAENKAPIEKSGYPMDISLSNDGKKMGVSYMSMETGSINTKIAFYNFDTVGANEIDHLVSAKEYEDALVPELEFVNATTAVVFGDGFYSIFQGSQKPVETVKKKEKQEIVSVFYSEAYIGMVLEATGETPYLMKIYDLKGKEVLSMGFDMAYDEIKIKDDNIYMRNSTQCRMYNMKGKLKFQEEFEEGLVDVLPLSEDRMVVVFGESVKTIKLK